MLTRIGSVLKDHGLRGALAALRARVLSQRARSYDACAPMLAGGRGLEVGGPSGIFSDAGVLPVYRLVASLDNCNFASTTLWEGRLVEGQTFRFHPSRPPGRQYIADAS